MCQNQVLPAAGTIVHLNYSLQTMFSYSVSYTHLDVYKRQVDGDAAAACNSIKPNLFLFSIKGQIVCVWEWASWVAFKKFSSIQVILLIYIFFNQETNQNKMYTYSWSNQVYLLKCLTSNIIKLLMNVERITNRLLKKYKTWNKCEFYCCLLYTSRCV